MITDGRQFDTNHFFSGGAGMFVQYHDVIKPVYLYVILQMILTGQSYGLPIDILSSMNYPALLEWYVNRRYINPIRCLDYANKMTDNQADALLNDIIAHDPSIVRIAPALNFNKMMGVYNAQHMSFPIYVYSEKEEPYIRSDCRSIFKGIDIKYLHGDLKSCISKCDQNFTYIFSDIELVKSASEILYGTCSHILLARDYRYNYSDNKKHFRYDLKELAVSHPFIRTGTTVAMNQLEMIQAFANLGYKEDKLGEG